MHRGSLGLLTLLLVGPAVARAQDLPGKMDLTPESEARYQRARAKAEPSVVAVIVSYRKYPGPAAAEPVRLGRYVPNAQTGDPKLDLSDPENWPDNLTGSGVVVDAAAGLVLTPYHLIEGATKVYIRTAAGSGSYADIHAADARSDLAVLRLLDNPGDLATVRYAAAGPNGARAAMPWPMAVLLVGYESNGWSPVAVPGWVVNSRPAPPPLPPVRDDTRHRALYQFGTLYEFGGLPRSGQPGGPGSSGCGLFNMEGELVGMTATLAVAADGYVIPFDRSHRRIVDALKAGREVEYGLLGVTLGGGPNGRFPNRFPDRDDADGVALTAVAPGGPAEAAGLVPMDRIVAIDGYPVRKQDDLFLHISAALAGTRVRIEFKRDRLGRGIQTTSATLDKSSHGFPWLASDRPAPVFGLRVDYASVQQVEKGTGLQPMPAGVKVRELIPGSPAEARFKQLGDAPTRWVVTAVDGTPTPKPAAFYAATTGKKSVTLSLVDPDTDATRQLTLPGP